MKTAFVLASFHSGAHFLSKLDFLNGPPRERQRMCVLVRAGMAKLGRVPERLKADRLRSVCFRTEEDFKVLTAGGRTAAATLLETLALIELLLFLCFNISGGLRCTRAAPSLHYLTLQVLIPLCSLCHRCQTVGISWKSFATLR